MVRSSRCESLDLDIAAGRVLRAARAPRARARRRRSGSSPASRRPTAARSRSTARDVTAPPAGRSRRRHGVPELRALPAHDGAPEHRLHRCAWSARPRPRSSARVREAARARSSIDHLLDRRPGQLSGGQQQRVRAGARDRARAEAVPPRRAALQPRRQAPPRDPRRAQEAAARARRHHDLRHPRPGGGDDDRRSHGDLHRGPAHAGRHARGGVRAARQRRGRLASSAARR